MAEESDDKQATTQAAASTKDGSEAEESVPRPSFKQFLESQPPSQIVEVASLLMKRSTQFTTYSELSLPDISLHCENEMCSGSRTFRSENEMRLTEKWSFDYVEYLCSNCKHEKKTYSLASRIDPKVEHVVTTYKFGELPVFGPRVPEKLKKLVGSDRELFFRGRQCESQGLGVGAFAYYRRVVEDRKNKLLDRLIAVISTIEPENEIISELEEAKNESQFSKAIESIKGAFPKALLINGENPLTLLYRALSQGMHNHTDAECLELARSIRVVLSELIDRMDRLVKDDQDLTDALKTLRDPSLNI